MMSSLAISDAVLAFASIFGVFLLAQKKAFAEVHRVSASAAMVGFMLMSLGAIAGSIRYGISDAWTGPHLLLLNVATYMSPPLIGIATCLGLTTLSWSKAVWGRLIIAICLIYEVSRWNGMEIIYRDLQLALILVAVLYLTLRSLSDSAPRWMIIGSIISYFIGALVIGTQGKLGGYLRLDLFRYLIGLGNLLLSSGLYMILKNSYPEELENQEPDRE